MSSYKTTLHSLAKFYGFVDGLEWRDHELEVEEGIVQGLRDEDGEHWDPTPEQLTEMISQGVIIPW
jgi:hypothetical protein